MNFRASFLRGFLFFCCLQALVALRAQDAPFSLSQAMQYPKYETRAVWITVLNSLDWPDTKSISAESRERQKREICEQLDRFKEARFNTILMQTRIRGDVIYPSSIEPFTDELTGIPGKDPGYDPLAFIIEECHKRGMEFHAWVVAIPLGSDKHVKSLGKRSIAGREPSLCMHYRGFWYLNPGHPKAKEYLFSVVKEMVTRYDVDGINFDYIRYPDGRTRLPDRATYRKYGNGKSLAQWRRDNLTEMVRYIYKGIKEIKPHIKVGSSPLGKYKDTRRYSSRGWNAYHTVFQDAQAWLKEGIHDIVLPMVYFREENFYPFVLDWKENSNGRTIVPGLGIYFLEEANWPLKDVEQQIYFTRSAQTQGQAYFRARFLLDNCGGLFDAIGQDVYPYPALIPPMSWQDSIAPTHPTHLSVREEDDRVYLSWEASQDSSARSADDTGIRYNVYASTITPVDTELPQHLIATYLKDTCYVATARKGEKLYFAVTAVDCFGNESSSQDTVMYEKPKPPVVGFRDVVPVQEVQGTRLLLVTDLYGREVLRQAYGAELNIESLEVGAYTLRYLDGKGLLRKQTSFIKSE